MLWIVPAAAAFLLAVPGHAAAQPTSDQLAAKVVIIAVPDLRWSDLASMPQLAAYAGTASIGDLSVRAEPTASRCADGSLTFAAGNRADAGGAVSCTISDVERASFRGTLRHDRYGADIAAFGDALNGAGVTTAALGPGANLLVADAAGRVDVVAPDLTAAMSRAQVVAVQDDQLYAAPAAGRAAAAHQLDAMLATQLGAIPANVMTIVAGSSDGPTGGPHLHVVMIHGPGWRHVELGAPNTRSRFVQLIDLAPTVLATLHISTPASMIGRPVFDTARAAPSAATFVDADRHDLAARRLDGTVRTAFGIAAIAVLGLIVAAWRRRSRRWHDTAMWLSRWALGLPLASYLLQLVPWWRTSLGWYPAMLAGVMVVLAALTTVAIRRSAAAGVVAIPLLMVAVLAVDQLLGAPLQASAPLGNLALVAGRFRGMGNIAFACFCAAALLCAGVVGGQLRDRDHRRAALVVALSLCVVATATDAAPPWGDDFGGVLAMTPCTVLLLALLADVRVTAKRVLLTVIGAIVVGVGVAAADYSRPAADQTHIGTFAGQVLHGGAARTLARKLYSDDHSFGNVAVTGSVALLIIVAIVWREHVSTALRRVAGLREAAIALGLLAAVGTAVNDSGVVIAEFALVTGLLAVVGAGVASPESAVASRRPPLPAPTGGLGSAQRG
jgi:hypothetical protein